MRVSQVFASPYQSAFDPELNNIGDDWEDGKEIGGNKDFQFGFGLPGMHHVMHVYLMPGDHEQSAWKIAGMAMLLVTALFLGLVIIYYCVKCCCCRKKTPVTVEGENADEAPGFVDGEHRVSLPEDLPSLDAPEKQAPVPASFLSTPTLNVSQPYQPEPEDLARMQAIMLQRLESTPEEWEMDHGDFDRKQLF